MLNGQVPVLAQFGQMSVPSVQIGYVQVSTLAADAVTASPWPSDPAAPTQFLNAQCSLRSLYGGKAMILRSTPSGPMLDVAASQLSADDANAQSWLSRCKWCWVENDSKSKLVFDNGCQGYPEYVFDWQYEIDLATANGVLGARASLGAHILLLFATILNGGLMCEPAELFHDVDAASGEYDANIAAAIATKIVQADVAQAVASALLTANGPILVPMADDPNAWMLLPQFASTGIRIILGLSNITAQLDTMHTVCLDTIYLALDVLV